MSSIEIMAQIDATRDEMIDATLSRKSVKTLRARLSALWAEYRAAQDSERWAFVLGL